jgi:TetR/AcrR family transcriptional regulator, lmrAB and yxaGH operons repressor
VDATARRVGRSEAVARKVPKRLAKSARKTTRTEVRDKGDARLRSKLQSAQEGERPRDRMVAGAAALLAQRGLQATSFSEVLEFTGSPRGSVYHHFPGGKEQLVKAALDYVTEQMGNIFSPNEGASPEDVTDLFLGLWRGILLRYRFKAGCAVLAVTVAADSPELSEHAATIFRAWRARLTGLFAAAGVAKEEAARFAATLLAASEGAVVLSRSAKSLEPFDLVAAQLKQQARSLPRNA